jgi:hypothetical protein
LKTPTVAVRFVGLLASAVALAVVGCGGGGGGGNVPTDRSAGRNACSLNQFSPNYAAGLPLAYWPQFPIHVYIDTSSQSYTPDLGARALAALDRWIAGTGGQAAYVVVSNQGDSDISVGFVPLGNAILEGDDTSGITYYYPGSDSAATADARYAFAKIYVGIDGDVRRENGTMGHEFGHALGIHGHSPDFADIMYYAWNPNRSPGPTARDINTLNTAYCGLYTRAETRSAPRHDQPMPPLSAPGWQAIP